MIWQPLNLSEICPANTPVTACSSFGYVYLNLLVQLYGGSVDQRKKERCREEADDEWTDGREYDFIVVGAGAAGCVVASRLTENPKWKVLLLEAGPEEPDVTSVPGFTTPLLNSNIDWKYTTEPNGKSCLAYSGRCSWPRGKTMGGSSSINAITYTRGNRADYDGWASLGNEGWSYDEVLPFFKKSEANLNIESLDRKYHSVKGEQYISHYPYIGKPAHMLTEAFVQAGLPYNDYNGAQQEGAIQAQALAAEGERVSANVAFIRTIRHQRPNLYVETSAEARKILIDEYNNAYGIVYIKNNMKYTAYAKKEVIISCGSINSPKLLMLSGIGPREHLESLNIPLVQDLPVGKNLHDHVTFNGIAITFSNKTSTAIPKEDLLRAIRNHAYSQIKDGPLASNGPVNSIAFLKTQPDLNAPDIQFQFNHIPYLKEFFQDPITAEKAAILPTSYYEAVSPRAMNIVPYSRGEMFLNSTDPHASPILIPNYLGDDRDFEPLLKAFRFLLSLEETEAFKSHEAYFYREKMPHCTDYDWGTDEYIICLAKHYTSCTHHQVGTCKMGPKCDETAVLDNELRVHGVESLRVIDASMMPNVMRGNTVAPTMMIGERGVDFVIKYWKARMRSYC